MSISNVASAYPVQSSYTSYNPSRVADYKSESSYDYKNQSNYDYKNTNDDNDPNALNRYSRPSLPPGQGTRIDQFA